MLESVTSTQKEEGQYHTVMLNNSVACLKIIEHDCRLGNYISSFEWTENVKFFGNYTLLMY